MRRLPPLSALRAFEAAARRLSFKDAAEELGLTPTAISHHVRLLEDHCGVKLFRRRPRPLALTPAGETLLPGLREGFDAFAAALSSIGRAAARHLDQRVCELVARAPARRLAREPSGRASVGDRD
jgi:LysR family glycine cleavage system transcriptional activator